MANEPMSEQQGERCGFEGCLKPDEPSNQVHSRCLKRAAARAALKLADEWCNTPTCHPWQSPAPAPEPASAKPLERPCCRWPGQGHHPDCPTWQGIAEPAVEGRGSFTLDLRSSHERIRELEARVTDLQNANTRVRAEIASLREQLAAMTKDRDGWRELDASAVRRVDELEARVTELQGFHAANLRLLESERDELRAAEQAIDKLIRQVAAKEFVIDELQQFVAERKLLNKTTVEAEQRAKEATERARKAEEALEDMRARKDEAYWERNRLVAFLSSLYPSHLSTHPDDPEWDAEWMTIVCVHTPAGQMTWHVHDSQLAMFNGHLLPSENHWDGHTTHEKYHRLFRLAAAARQERAGEE